MVQYLLNQTDRKYMADISQDNAVLCENVLYETAQKEGLSSENLLKHLFNLHWKSTMN